MTAHLYARIKDFGDLLGRLAGSADSDRLLRHLARSDAHDTWNFVRLHPEKLRGPVSVSAASNEVGKMDMGVQGAKPLVDADA